MISAMRISETLRVTKIAQLSSEIPIAWKKLRSVISPSTRAMVKVMRGYW